MDPQQQREILFRFIDALPQAVLDQLSQKNLDTVVLVHDIGATYEFVLKEMGIICEGVKKVLAGEDSASNLVAFIQQDERIEEDNRPKIPALAYEIQQKIFDPVLPILKGAGFPIKEGRVQVPPTTTAQPTTDNRQPTTSTPSSASVPRSVPSQFSVPLDERNIRALTRIAAGTKYSEQELRETFEELPVGLRQSLSSVDTANAIERVAKKYLLHVDQMASLASETGLVLLGLTHLADFVANLAKRLRLPEAEAKEIARDISAEIFVKVRDSLRGLHEGKPSYENTNVTNIRMAANQKEESRKENIESRISNIEKTQNTQRDASQLNANRYPPVGGLNASLQTPFSPQAQWNTGVDQPPTTDRQQPKEENILARQARLKESLTREEVLRGIENPRLTYENTNYTNQRMTTNKTEVATTPGRGVVGPTGWKAQQNEIRTMKYEPAGRPIQQQTPVQPQRLMPTPPAPPKSRPQSESAFPPPKPKPKPETEDFLEQKLQKPMTMPREERRYTTDPYREPLE